MRKRGAKTYCERSKVKKHLFPTQEKAEVYMRNLILRATSIDGGLPQRVYYCESCGGWHMTSKAHILQQHIDDGSAVLNPAPILVDQVQTNFIQHEDKLQQLRHFYDSWEKKCDAILKQIEKKQIMAAETAIHTLVRCRVRRKLSLFEKEHFTDRRKKLVEKTLVLQRRVNNILNGKTRKNRPVIAAPEIKCRYVPEPKIYPNPMIIISDFQKEVSELLMQLDDPSFSTSIKEKGACYRKARNCVRSASRALDKNEEHVDITVACFSIEAEPMKSIVEGYENILARLAALFDVVDKEDVRSQQRVKHLANVIKFRLEVILQGLPGVLLEDIFRDCGMQQLYVDYNVVRM